MTNLDMAIEVGDDVRFLTRPNLPGTSLVQLRQAIEAAGVLTDSDVCLGVTGGRYRQLPDRMDDLAIVKVDEMQAVGRGGLVLSGLDDALVVSAGTGTAMVAAKNDDSYHVTGSAVGGGTLLGLSKVLLELGDPMELDLLAKAGDASNVDMMLKDAVGGEIGQLPAEANAVNLGKLVDDPAPSRADLAAGLVRLVAQVIAVIALNAAKAEGLLDIVMIGHLMDLETIRAEVDLVGKFYHQSFIVPHHPGLGTVLGVLNLLKTRYA